MIENINNNNMAHSRNTGITNLLFNQDTGCFTCCMTTGLRVYNVQPLVEKTHYGIDEIGEVTLCEMVLRSNWLLLVRAQRPCTVALLDDTIRQFTADVTFKTPVLAIRAKPDKAAIVLASSIQVLILPSLQRIALLRTPTMPRPLCALASEPGTGPHYIAAPAHTQGSVQLWDISRVVRGAMSSSPAVMSCHLGQLVCLALSSKGSRLVTASNRGTKLRVWDTHSHMMLHEVKRGSDYADIYCLNFNVGATLMCCVSDKGTLHVWDITTSPATHLATAHAPPDTRAICAFLNNNTTVVVSADGTFHKFTYSVEGSCHRTDFDYFLQVGDDDEFVN